MRKMVITEETLEDRETDISEHSPNINSECRRTLDVGIFGDRVDGKHGIFHDSIISIKQSIKNEYKSNKPTASFKDVVHEDAIHASVIVIPRLLIQTMGLDVSTLSSRYNTGDNNLLVSCPTGISRTEFIRKSNLSAGLTFFFIDRDEVYDELLYNIDSYSTDEQIALSCMVLSNIVDNKWLVDKISEVSGVTKPTLVRITPARGFVVNTAM